MATPLKIASWNINSVRFRLDSVQRFLAEEQPDILCLQETKVINNDFPEGPFRQLGYNFQKLNGQPMHHGVAIIAKVRLSDDNRLDWQANGRHRAAGERLCSGRRRDPRPQRQPQIRPEARFHRADDAMVERPDRSHHHPGRFQHRPAGR
ncbi:MAG: endonuclease/exonuclease/phosphatase family protein [Blastomonas fulva]